MLKHLKQALVATLVLTVLCGLAYPFAMTGFAQLVFPAQAHGGLISKDGTIIGAGQIGQVFATPVYFHGRPSATTATDPNDSTKTVPAPYNASNSGASNYAPTAKGLVDDVQGRVDALKVENPDARTDIPVDLVTTSASGLDPDISPAAAFYQVPRVAAARSVAVTALDDLVKKSIEGRVFGLLGEPHVTVLKLNLALDAAFPAPPASAH
jgi:K+-transporting ATPase ATPase C chain